MALRSECHSSQEAIVGENSESRIQSRRSILQCLAYVYSLRHLRLFAAKISESECPTYGPRMHATRRRFEGLCHRGRKCTSDSSASDLCVSVPLWPICRFPPFGAVRAAGD